MPGERVLHTPAGKCPVKLHDTSVEEVKNWSNLVLEHGRQNNLVYLPSALIYFSQQFYNIFTPEYKIVKQHIESIFNTTSKDDFIESQSLSLQKETSDKQRLALGAILSRPDENSIKEASHLIKKEEIAIEKTEVVVKRKRGRPPKNK